jgi:hypothetical protein
MIGPPPVTATAFPTSRGHPMVTGKLVTRVHGTNFDQQNENPPYPRRLQAPTMEELEQWLPMADATTSFSNEATHPPLPIERPPFPPNIPKEELTFKGRLFDGNYSDVHRAEWKGQMVNASVLY